MPSMTKKFELAKRALDINNMPEYTNQSEFMNPTADCRRIRLRKRARAQETVPCTCKDMLLATDVYKYEDAKYKKGVILNFEDDDWVARVEFENKAVDRVDLRSSQVRLALSTCLKQGSIPDDIEVVHAFANEMQPLSECPKLMRRTPSPAPFDLDEIAPFELPLSMDAANAAKANRKGHIYTEDEEAYLIQCVQTYGKKWKIVASMFANKYKHIQPPLSLVQIRSKYCRIESAKPNLVVAQKIYDSIMDLEQYKQYKQYKRDKTLRAQRSDISNDETDAVNALLHIHYDSPSSP